MFIFWLFCHVFEQIFGVAEKTFERRCTEHGIIFLIRQKAGLFGDNIMRLTSE